MSAFSHFKLDLFSGIWSQSQNPLDSALNWVKVFAVAVDGVFRPLFSFLGAASSAGARLNVVYARMHWKTLHLGHLGTFGPHFGPLLGYTFCLPASRYGLRQNTPRLAREGIQSSPVKNMPKSGHSFWSRSEPSLEPEMSPKSAVFGPELKLEGGPFPEAKFG